MKPIKIVLAVSLAVNVLIIPYLVWELVGYYVSYMTDIPMTTEIAFAAGYYKAKGNDLKESIEYFPTMLQIAAIEPNSIDVNLWPAKKYVMHIDIEDKHFCKATVFKKE